MDIEDDLTYKIIGCAMKVHGFLGNGFQERIYQRALAIEMKRQNLSFQRESPIPIFYDGECVGRRRADFLVEKLVLLELKAIIQLEDVHLAQALNYLVAYNVPKGLLLNFGARSLEIKRLLHPKKRPIS
jgi:GxxExxY protein